jgi:hypothetical protein
VKRWLASLAVLTCLLAGCVVTSPRSGEIWHDNSYITGYTWQDNNPPNSAEICCPSVHQTAGGTGTYADPITVAVDDTQLEGSTALQFPAGTRFYIPNLRAYFVAEDRTGEIQQDNTAAHHGTNPHLDVWIDGRTETAAQSDACAQSITAEGLRVIQNPQSDLLVVQGPIAANGQCRQNYGNTVNTAT